MSFSNIKKEKSMRENLRANDLAWRKVSCAQPMATPEGIGLSQSVGIDEGTCVGQCIGV